MQTVKKISFRRIAHLSDLFLSYLDLARPALAFFQQPPTFESLEQVAGHVSRESFDRGGIVSILRRQNERLGCGPGTLQHIHDLEDPGSVAIVTGQQVGLFSGPLYTIYKAFTAIRIAEELRARRISAVPIFWMDTEDHDLAEVTHRTVVDADLKPTVQDYRETLFGGDVIPVSPVGSIRFPDGISRVVQEYLTHLTDSDWKGEIRSQLESIYRPGSTFGDAFGKLLSRLFREYGLILFDSEDPQAKRLVSGVFRKALEEADEIRAALIERNQALVSAGFHAQVHVLENSTVLFLDDEGERKSLVRQDTGFCVKHGSRSFSLNDMIRIAESSPEKFSPNALLRPIVQDKLFPTVAYVGGPAEIAYFAQIEVLYRMYARPMPVIWPRSSFTLIEPEVGADMDRLGIEFEDCFHGRQHLTEKALHHSKTSSAENILEGMRNGIGAALDEVRPAVETLDASLGPAMITAKNKILHQLESLRAKFVRLEARQDDSLVEKIDRVLGHCFPNKNLQERELSVHYFMSRHGPSLLDTVYSLAQSDTFTHQIVRLK